MTTIAGNLSPYGPFVFPQDQHERLLIERLAAAGVMVERNTELLRFSAAPDTVSATLRGPDGADESCEAAYLAACDGARSIVRQGIGAEFPGGTYEQLFYVADVDAAGPALDGELHVGLDAADFLAVFPLKGAGRARLIGTVRGDRAAHPESLRFDDVSARAIEQMQVKIRTVNWFSTYHVHHRVADRFRQGRIFLLGDAAHIHSPAGGQGMNTGIGDAINLAWKLHGVLTGQAPDALLDTYEVERRAFALKLVATTDRGFTLATAESRTAALVRMRIVPIVVPALFKLQAVRNFLYRAVSQLVIEYRDSAISRGAAGRIHGGDRLPWAKTAHGDNFDTLTTATVAAACLRHCHCQPDGVVCVPGRGSCVRVGGRSCGGRFRQGCDVPDPTGWLRCPGGAGARSDPDRTLSHSQRRCASPCKPQRLGRRRVLRDGCKGRPSFGAVIRATTSAL